MLSDWHDTEDAFQATFLVLVTKARGLWVRDSLGPWLHQVAFRTASSARISAARRRRIEDRLRESSGEKAAGSSDDLGHVLHEEIERLPERYRVPLVLCDLESRTHQQAARPRLADRHGQEPAGARRERLRQDSLVGGWRQTPRCWSRPAETMALLPLKLPALVDSTARVAAGLGTAKAIAAGFDRYMARDGAESDAHRARVQGRRHGARHRCGRNRCGEFWPRWPDQATSRGEPKKLRPPSCLPRQYDPVRLHAVVSEPGLVDTRSSSMILCRLEGQSIIKWILPDQSVVRKGDLVGELDSQDLNDQLKKQLDAVKVAEASYLAAKAIRELAELAPVEFQAGVAVSRAESPQGCR